MFLRDQKDLSTRVYVPSSELGPPTTFHASECVSLLGPKVRGEQHSLTVEGGPNLDDWSESLALCILCAKKRGFIMLLIEGRIMIVVFWHVFMYSSGCPYFV
jgi:hypothetical protein